MDLKSKIREVPDFPKKGILFYDITTLLKEKEAFAEIIAQLTNPFYGKNIEKVVAVESRGFIFGTSVAQQLHAGFVPVRKPGKLPSKTLEEPYQLEYGSDRLAIHEDAVSDGERVLIVDDLLATGGTISATVNLVKKLGGNIVSVAFVIELLGLKGRERLSGIPIFSLLTY
ncbi:MAG: adenine phosphoribosyltransferase [Nitrospirae bacterium]|nr:adenine phosphoribosyltransferase [Candidatus Troglogloeales bacterium]MBI3598181.1 adenine phosphoribosyltransferase [Candidatus Troglogloeales bacterium]